MSHAHAHDEPHTRSYRALVIALVINTVFFIVILVGAVIAGSVTLLAEAAHMLTDSLSLIVAIVAAWIAGWTPDVRRTYGYHRAEVLGGFLNALLLLAVVGYVLFEAVSRLRAPEPVNAEVVIVVGVIGVLSNLAAAWVLLGHRDSLNVEGAFLHLVADAAGSALAIVLGVSLLFTNYYLLDPIFALVIAAFILYTIRDLLVDSVNILMQGTPRRMDLETLSLALAQIPGVVDVHDVHVWAIDSNRTALSVHLVVGPAIDVDETLDRARTVAAGFDIDHATIQIESSAFTETREFDCYPVAR